MTDPLGELSRRGVSVWLDDLSRQRLTTGSLASLIARDHVVGVTTNPTIFAKAISGGDGAYAGQLHDLWMRGTCVHEALRALTTHDVRWACDLLRPVYDTTDGIDGRVSIEVDPRLAAAGARPQRPLWASTSVKDPAYPDTRYVTDLVAPGVVNTMPEATLRAVADHGRIPADSVRAHYAEARVLSRLAVLGIDYDEVTTRLEEHSLEMFDTSWRELSEQLAVALRIPRQNHQAQKESGNEYE